MGMEVWAQNGFQVWSKAHVQKHRQGTAGGGPRAPGRTLPLAIQERRTAGSINGQLTNYVERHRIDTIRKAFESVPRPGPQCARGSSRSRHRPVDLQPRLFDRPDVGDVVMKSCYGWPESPSPAGEYSKLRLRRPKPGAQAEPAWRSERATKILATIRFGNAEGTATGGVIRADAADRRPNIVSTTRARGVDAGFDQQSIPAIQIRLGQFHS